MIIKDKVNTAEPSQLSNRIITNDIRQPMEINRESNKMDFMFLSKIDFFTGDLKLRFK